MTKVIVLIFTFFSSITVFGQTFEGKIFYSSTYKSNNPQMSDQQLASMMGSSQEYLIKGGDYKSIANGTLVQWQLYRNSDNKLYTKMSNSETALWIDASIQGDEVLKAEVQKEVIEILGYKCDELILTCKSGIQKYYFNRNLSVNATLFTNHKFGNWFDYLSKSNSLPLKSVIETAHFTMESVATEVKAMKLDSDTFEIPEGLKSEKSPY